MGTIFSIYGFWVGWILYFAAAAFDAGRMFPMLSGKADGPDFIKNMISLGMLTILLAFIGLGVIVLIGLRNDQKA